MAMNEADLARWIEARGPYLYHVPDEGTQSSILEQGLLPWNQVPGRERPPEPWTPRPGHVYLGMRLILHECIGGAYEEMLCIDLRHLDPARLDPDEDAFWSDTLGAGPLWRPDMGLTSPRETVRDENTYTDYLIAKHGELPYDVPADNRPYGNYGQWAEANDLGSNPEHTLLSLEHCGTISYRGSISTGAIKAVSQPRARRPAHAV